MPEAKPEHLIGDRTSDRNGLDNEYQARWGEHDCTPSVDANIEDPRRPLPQTVPAQMGRRAVLCVVAMETALGNSMGVLRVKLPRFWATRVHHHVAQAMFR